jgi:hypothetical protein
MPHHYLTVAVILLLLACLVIATDTYAQWRERRRQHRQAIRVLKRWTT